VKGLPIEKYRVSRTIGGCTIILLAALLFTGCGRTYSLAGLVVSLTGSERYPPGIHEVIGGPMPALGEPVPGAVVTLFHQLDSKDQPVRESVWQKSTQTNAGGRFELHDYAAPGKRNLVGLEVSAAGMRTAYTAYVDFMDPDLQAFFVVLEPARP
jgi:hypothetical protein